MIELIYYTNGPNKGKIDWESTCPTIKEVQEFITENKITHSELRDKYAGLRSRCRNQHWTEDIVFEKDCDKFEKQYDTIEKVQETLDQSNISSLDQFKTTYSRLYNLCKKNNWIEQLKLTTFDEYNTVEDVNKLVKEENLSHKEFLEKYPSLHKKYIRNNTWFGKVLFRVDKHEWDSYTLDKIQQLTSYLSPDRFKLIYPELYKKCVNENLIDQLRFRGYWGTLTLEEVQKLITEENLSFCEFKDRHPSLYSACSKNNLIDSLVFKEVVKSWSSYDTIEKVQEFINVNDLSPTEFHDKYPGLYRRSRFFNWYDLLVFPNRKSRMENHFDDLYPIKSYPMIKRDSYELHWLKTDHSSIPMRPDILIDTDKVKLVIEFQGDQHFYMSEYMHKTEENYQKMIERDELKYKLLIEHGFTVIYFVDFKLGQYVINHFPEKFEPGGYIGGTTIITSWDELKSVVDKALGEI